MWRSAELIMPAGAIVLALALTAPSSAPSKGTRFEQAQRLFGQADFDGALRQLEVAAQDERDDAQLERIHLLRGQCFAARQDFVRAEEAFTLALEANPEAALDPAKVDPTVVKMLEAVRARLTSVLTVHSMPPGAVWQLDGKPQAEAPRVVAAPIGKHRLEMRWGEGPWTAFEVVLKPRRETRIEFVSGQPSVPIAPEPPKALALRPFGDLRGVVDIPAGAPVTAGVDFGAGLYISHFRVGLSARLFPYFGLLPRAAFAVPVLPKLSVFLELHVPFLFRSGGVGTGIGGAAGAEFEPMPWFGVFAQVGGQHLFLNPNRGDHTTFHASGGVRLRVP